MSLSRLARAAMLALALVASSPIVSTPAHAAQSGELQLPKLQEATLRGGVKLRMLERHDLPLVTLIVAFPGGSAADPAGQEGLANFTVEMLRAGAADRDVQAIARTLDSMGANLSANVDRDSSRVSLEVMSRDLPEAVALLADLLVKPTFPEAEVERTKRKLLAAIQNVKDTPEEAASVAYLDQLYRGHPYGHPEIGYEGSVTKLTRADLVKFHQGVYRPENAIVTVVGDFKSADLKKSLDKAFGTWRAAVVKSTPLKVEVPPAPAPIKGRQLVLVHKPELTQAQIRIGNLGYAAGDAGESGISLANTALGVGFTSRLLEEIRVNRSLSYGASSNFRPWKQPGPFTVTTFTKNETVGETLKVALDVVGDFKKNGMKKGELAKSRAFAVGRFATAVETPDALALWLTRLQLYGLPLDYLTKYAVRLKETPEDAVKAAIARIPAEDVLILVYADKTKIESQLKDFPNITVVESLEYSPGQRLQK